MKTNDQYIEQLNEIGRLLSEEKDSQIVMKKILTTARFLSHADAGTFYLVSSNKQSLEFCAVQTDSLNINLSQADGTIPWPNLSLYNEDKTPNDVNISAYCALNNKLINIEDVYHSKEFDFKGPKAYDKASGYRTKSMLVVPLKSYDDTIIGVLQLINKQDEKGHSIPFEKADEKLILSMGSQAAISITQSRLVKDLEKLLDSFVQAIATAIGEKSKYTQGHINRVAELTQTLAHAVNDEEDPELKELFFNKKYPNDKSKIDLNSSIFTQDEIDQLDLAAWMHDVGKITTPDHIIDKATKLETIYDRIKSVTYRFEILQKEKHIEMIEAISEDPNNAETIKNNYQEIKQKIQEDLEFLQATNFGAEFMSDDNIERVYEISEYQITINAKKENILTQDEIENLCIQKGTLTDKERTVINNHAKLSYEILNSLPFPSKFKRVPEIAAGHHEKINGEGYPLGLAGDEITFEARLVAIADIFESLTASDRPYKKPNTIKQSLRILKFMVKDGELDKDLVKYFIDKKLYLDYAKNNLLDEQIDTR